MRDNYTEMRNRMRTQFLQYDQAEMIRRFSLRHDAEYIHIRFVARDYRIGRANGVVEWSEDGFVTCTEADYSESMSIYDVLCCSKPDCCLSGEFMPDGSLKGTVFTGATKLEALKLVDCAGMFDAHPDELKIACERLGGMTEGRGDVAFRIPVFVFLPIRFAFWHGDEDFPPEIRILWDGNVLDYMHYETLWFIKGHLLRRLMEEIRNQLPTEG